MFKMLNATIAVMAAKKQSLSKFNLNMLESKEHWLRWALIAALVAITGFVIWFNQYYSDPQNVFWGMITNSLSTPGVTKEASQKSATTQINGSTRLWFNPQPMVKNIRNFTDTSAGAPTRVTLESIANSTAVYQHYSFIDQPGVLGKAKPDYSTLYGLWLKNGGEPSVNGQVFNNGLLGIILFGNLAPPQRIKLVNFLKTHHVYINDFKAVTKNKNAKHEYTYNVKVNLKNLALATQLYAKLLGLPVSSQVDPNNFPASVQQQVAMSVNSLNRQLTKFSYPNGASPETFVSFGQNNPIVLPSETVSVQTFQNALNAVNQ